jgi:hypothetical protein
MAKSKTIRVTPNVLKCLDELKTAVKSMPAGHLKKRANGAIAYLDRAFKGERQPLGGSSCPPDRAIVART